MEEPVKEIKELSEILMKFIPKFLEIHKKEKITLMEIVAKVEVLYFRPEGLRPVYYYVDAINLSF